MIKLGIFFLCRDDKTKDKLEYEMETYGFQDINLVTGLDYFTFLDKIIVDSRYDFALVCHDDVVMPINMAERARIAIENANNQFGAGKWGVLGNAGVEYLSNKTVTFIRDPHTALIPYRSKPLPVVSIDGNTLLLNLKALKEKSVRMPEELSGFHLYDMSLLIECYRKGLVCAIDPELFVFHKSGGNQEAFDHEVKHGKFPEYWRKLFINNSVLTINGPISIETSLDYLKRDSSDTRKDFYNLVSELLYEARGNKNKKTIFVITRTQLNRLNFLRRFLDSCRIATAINSGEVALRILLAANNLDISDEEAENTLSKLTKEYHDLDIDYIIVRQGSKQYPRVASINEAIKRIPTHTDCYVWIVDDDDFILPDTIKKLPQLLDTDTILVGNAACFEEVWEDNGVSIPIQSTVKPDFYHTEMYYKGIFGDNFVPVSAVIYPLEIIQKVFASYKLEGDYYEDYAILLLAQCFANVKHYPILLVGISHHGDNTILAKDRVHWDYSLTTFVSEIVNKGVIKKWEFDLASVTGSLQHEAITLSNQLGNWYPVIKRVRPLIRTVKPLIRKAKSFKVLGNWLDRKQKLWINKR